MNNYVAWAIQHANDQGFSGGDLLRNALALYQLTLFTSPPSGYDTTYATGSNFVGTCNSAGTNRVYYTTLEQVYNASYSVFAPPPFAGYYGVDARLSLMIAIAQGMTGAQAAYNYLDPQIQSNYANRAGWAIDLRTSPNGGESEAIAAPSAPGASAGQAAVVPLRTIASPAATSTVDLTIEALAPSGLAARLLETTAQPTNSQSCLDGTLPLVRTIPQTRPRTSGGSTPPRLAPSRTPFSSRALVAQRPGLRPNRSSSLGDPA